MSQDSDVGNSTYYSRTSIRTGLLRPYSAASVVAL